jgi:hypothetical protein
MKTTHRMPDGQTILTEYRAVVAYQPKAEAEEFRNFLAGARAALEWVIGRSARTPATARTEPATLESMEREQRFCDQVIYSPGTCPPIDRDYANGVEHALSWVRGVEDVPPTPLEEAAPARLCTCR